MAISLETFRAFAGQNLSARTTLNLGDAAKTTLAATRFAGDRPLASRVIAAREAEEDNIYVRSQLLAAVRDALGGEDDAYFARLQTTLFGISATAPQADAALAAKPLALREVRAALAGLDARLAQKATAAAFAARIDADFAAVSACNRDVVRAVLLPQLRAAQAADPGVGLAALTGPGSAFALLRDLLAAGGGSMRVAHLARTLPPHEAPAFLKACALIVPASPQGFDLRLHAVADRLAALKKLTPESVFKLAWPGVAWPKGVATGAPLPPQAREALAQAVQKGRAAALLEEVASCADPVRQAALGDRLAALNAFFDLGMAADDAQAVLDDPAAFRADMLPPAAFLAGAPRAGADAARAFEQSAADAGRQQFRVTVTKGRETWQLPASARLADHPLKEIALQDYREQVETLCGAGEAMKANVFSFISKGGQPLAGAFGRLLGADARVRYTLDAKEDGSVVVSRDVEGRARGGVSTAVRFFPDGSMRLERAPTVKIDAAASDDLTAADREAARAQDRRTADAELCAYVQQRYAQPFADLFKEEIAALMRAYPDAGLSRDQYRMRAGNMVGVYLSEHADAAAAFIAQPEEGRRATLAEIKAACFGRTMVNMASLAIRKQCLAEAAAAVRAMSGAPADAPVDVERLTEKIGYCKLADGTTVADIERQYRALKDAFVQERAEVFAFIRDEAARRPEAMPGDLRAALCVEARERPRLARAGVQAALALARALADDLPPAGTRGPDALEGLFRGFGRTVRTTFAALDPKAVGAEQRGNMLTLAVLSLAHVHRAWFAPLFEALADDARARLEEALTPPARDAARAAAPEQSDADLELTYARTLFKSFCEELKAEHSCFGNERG